MDSILNSIKRLLGLGDEYTHFDPDIIIHINTVFNILYQMGLGQPFSITSANETWYDYVSDLSKLEMVKTYTYLKVRLYFDPPTGGLLEAINRQISELEWRISVQVDPGENQNE